MTAHTEPVVPRPPRLLWANLYCLLDSSSGASMSVRAMLYCLAQQGVQVQVLGATVFDHATGGADVARLIAPVQRSPGQAVQVGDGPLVHQLTVTASTRRAEVTCAEESAWFANYQHALDHFKPDLVFYYGGLPFDFLIAAEARVRGIPVALYLANGNYRQSRAFRDVDLVLTDSRATARRYRSQMGIEPVPVGKFIDASAVVAPRQSRERILFINPVLEKGVALVVRLALMLEQRRPDVVFEVVESRGQWAPHLLQITTALGTPRTALSNVVVTPNTRDMRPVYGRARLLLMPSLGWESGGRVLAEAMLNGIPAITTDHGGTAEMVQDGGIVLRLPDRCHQQPYTALPSCDRLMPLVELIEALFDDPEQYAGLSARALRVGQTLHHIDTSTQRLVQALQPWLALRAGDVDGGAQLARLHRHGLDDRVPLPGSHHSSGGAGAEMAATDAPGARLLVL